MSDNKTQAKTKTRNKQVYSCYGSCCSFVEFTVDKEDRVWDISLVGGCPGHRTAFAKLAEGRSIHVLIKMLEGIHCREIPRKGKTSCADQFAQALKKYLETHPKQS